MALKKSRAKEFGTAVACESGRKDRRGKKKNLGNEFGINKEMRVVVVVVVVVMGDLSLNQ